MAAHETQTVRLPMAALRQLVRREVDRRLQQVGSGGAANFVRGMAAASAGEPDEVAEVVAEYSIEDWSPALIVEWSGAGAELVTAGFTDELGRPLPSTLPEVAEASLTTAEAADLLGVNTSRIRQRLGERSLYGFKYEGSWRLPRWQFEGSTTVPNLDEVIRNLHPDESPVGVSRWFISPWEDLLTEDGTLLSPRRWLLEGRDPGPVLVQARMN